MSNKYRQINLYDAETKKRRTIALKRAQYLTIEDLEDAADKIKAAQRLKNAEYKAKKLAEMMETGLNAVADKAKERSKKKEEMVEMAVASIPKQFGDFDITHSPDVNLHLDAGTGNTTVILGSSKRGKTTLMMYLYNKYYKNDPSKDRDNITTLFSGNPHLSTYKGDKNLLVGYGFTRRHAKYIQMEQFINVKCKNKYNFVNLFDDIIDAKYSSVVNNMILTYRNANISCVMCLQYTIMLSKQNRGSVNNTIVFGANSLEDAELVVEKFLKSYLFELGFTTKASQIALYRHATQNHGFIYIDNLNGTLSFHRLPKP